MTPAASRALDRLTRSVFLRVDAKIQALSADPRPSGCTKLQGPPDLYRVRSGDHRIVYQVKDAQLLVLVVTVGDRKDVYQNLYSGSRSARTRWRKKGTGSRPLIQPPTPGKSLAGRVPVPFFRALRECEPL